MVFSLESHRYIHAEIEKASLKDIEVRHTGTRGGGGRDKGSSDNRPEPALHSIMDTRVRFPQNSFEISVSPFLLNS